MMKKNIDQNIFDKRVARATKWSALTQIITKLVQPVITIILARLLLPEDFGLIANITMIVSFSEMFADAGFSKYIIQHEFRENHELNQYSLVAFWANLVIALLFLSLIIIFKDFVARLIGSEGYEWPLVVASFSIPLFSVVSIQKSIFIRNLDFKSLFYIRIISSLVPFIITVPIALVGGGYWSLIYGTISTNLISAIMLTVKSPLKPKFFFDFSILKSMFTFSYWTLIESITIWFSSWIDIFLINGVLSNYYIGLFKNSISLVNALTGIIVATFTPILFSALSRSQSDNLQFLRIYYKNQKIIGYLLFPISVGIFLFRDFITLILLGPNWKEASLIIGSWGFASGFVIVFSGFASEVYRSKGKPKVSVLHQLLWILITIPFVLTGIQQSFELFIYFRVAARFFGVIIAFILIRVNFKISPIGSIKTTFAPLISSICMGVLAIVLNNVFPAEKIFTIVTILVCTVFYYFFIKIVFNEDYNEIKSYLFKV